MTSTEIGKAGEDAACRFLRNQGLTLVTENFRCRMGEIDLIMRDGTTLVFIEVRLRQSENFHSGAESITRSKIRRLLHTAELFLQAYPEPDDTDFRFDVVSIGNEIEWIREAFTADDR